MLKVLKGLKGGETEGAGSEPKAIILMLGLGGNINSMIFRNCIRCLLRRWRSMPGGGSGLLL